MPRVPVGSGTSPIILVVISANDLESSAEFYSKVFGWQTRTLAAGLCAAMPSAPPSVALRAGSAEGFPDMVPFVRVPDVDAALKRVVALGGLIERAPWTVPMLGKLARFRDPAGTIYGVTSGIPASELPRVPMPISGNPKPAPGSVCHIEMYASDRNATGDFLLELFGWGSVETMSQYSAFDPGAGIGGILQSHTPAAPALAYIYVDDVLKKLEEIVASGGRKRAEPMKVPGMATFGYFTDPSGSSMGLIGP